MYIRQLIQQLEYIVEKEGHDQIEVSVWIPTHQLYFHDFDLEVDKEGEDIVVSIVTVQ